jgi:hypothetical protein
MKGFTKWVSIENGLNNEKYSRLADTDETVLKNSNGVKWCLRCERVYKVGSFKYDANDSNEKPRMYCPYNDCDGDYWIDGWEWLHVAALNNYPSTPQLGEKYPL